MLASMVVGSCELVFGPLMASIVLLSRMPVALDVGARLHVLDRVRPAPCHRRGRRACPTTPSLSRSIGTRASFIARLDGGAVGNALVVGFGAGVARASSASLVLERRKPACGGLKLSSAALAFAGVGDLAQDVGGSGVWCRSRLRRKRGSARCGRSARWRARSSTELVSLRSSSAERVGAGGRRNPAPDNRPGRARRRRRCCRRAITALARGVSGRP